MPKNRSAREHLAENAKPRSKRKQARAELKSATRSASAAPQPSTKTPRSTPLEPTRSNAELTQEIAERKEIEEELREAEQKANDLVRFAPTAIYEVDFRGPRFTRVNDAMCQMSGYSRAELLALNPFEILDQESQRRFRERIARTLAGQPIDESVEYRSITKDGQTRYAILNTRLLYEDGQPIGAFVIAHDITERRQAEQSMRESEDKYRTLFETITDAIIVLDPSGPGKVLSANPAACRLFGYDEEELLQLDREKLLDTSDPELGALMDQRDQAAPVTAQLTYRRKDGTRFTGEVRRTLHRDSAGRLQAVSIVRDVTERNRAEEVAREAMHALQETEAQLAQDLTDAQRLQEVSSQLIEQERVGDLYAKILDAAIAVMRADMGSLQALDAASHELQTLASRGFHPQSASFWQTVTAESGGTGAEAVRQGGRVIVPDVETCDWLSGTPDLDEFHRSGIRAIQSTPLVLRNGRVVGMISTHWREPHEPADREIRLLDVLARQAADFVERIHVQYALQEAHERRTEVLESIQDGFFALDREWRFVYVNSRAAANVDTMPAALIGQNLWEKFPGILGTAHETNYRKAMDDRVPLHFEMEGVLGPGSYDIRVSPSAEGISVYWLDISDRKQNELKIQNLNRELERQKAELVAANQDLESFSYSVSHDLRAPLGSIDGFTSMILKDYGALLPPETKRFVELVQENADQMSRLIEALLLLSRSSRQALKRQTVAPHQVAEDVLTMLRPQLKGRQVEIVMGNLPACQADPVLLRQVYANLLSNAIKFTRNRPSACIEVGSKIVQGETVYFVKDNGVGFSMDQASRLFGVFQRLHSEEEYEGTGIGLAIVQRIVRRHGGRVWAESEVDKGATFYFTL